MDKKQSIICKKVDDETYQLKIYHRRTWYQTILKNERKDPQIIPIPSYGKALRGEIKIPNMTITPLPFKVEDRQPEKCLLVDIRVEFADGKKRKKEETISLKLFKISLQIEPSIRTIPQENSQNLDSRRLDDLLESQCKKICASLQEEFRATLQNEATLQKEFRATLQKEFRATLQEEIRATVQKEIRAILQEESKELKKEIHLIVQEENKEQKKEIEKLKDKFHTCQRVAYTGHQQEQTRILHIDMDKNKLLLLREQHDALPSSNTPIDRVIFEKGVHRNHFFTNFFTKFLGLAQFSEIQLDACFKNQRIIEIVLNYIVNVAQVLRMQLLATGSITKIRLTFKEFCWDDRNLSPDVQNLKDRVVKDKTSLKHFSQYTHTYTFKLHDTVSTLNTYHFYKLAN